MAHDRYRTIAEDRIVAALMLMLFPFDPTGSPQPRGAIANAMEAWIELGLGFRRGADGVRLFDPVEIKNFLVWSGRDGRDGALAEQFAQCTRGLVQHLAAVRHGAKFALSLRRRFDISAVAAGAKLRLRMPIPCAGRYAADVELRPVVPDGLSAEAAMSEGRLEIRLAAGATTVEFGAAGSFVPLTPAEAATSLNAAELEVYLRPHEGPIQVTPRVAALAASLAAPGGGTLAAVGHFWDYLLDHCASGAVHDDQVTPAQGCEWVLDHGWYDCQLGSALLAALCRARNIPARLVGGHFLYRQAPTIHFWAEAWIAGRWLPFDLLSARLSRGGLDAAWRRHFFGRLDRRMVTQVLPLSFIGPLGVRVPPVWHMLQTAAEGGANIGFFHLHGGLIFQDQVLIGDP